MCGIVGYVGSGEAHGILRSGLESLEYRGYDSVGFALLDDHLSVYKQVGTVDELDIVDYPTANVGIGHTRWATHGPATNENAHPHTDCSGKLAVVHNGIITNHEELREELSSHVFRSETDTEVIPHLIEDSLATGKSLLEAVSIVVDRLEGSFAIAAIAENHEGIVATRRGSPLVLGHGDGQQFVASDVMAFIEYTTDVSYLENDDIIHLTEGGVSVFSYGGRVARDIVRTEWTAGTASKGGYDHYMHKEIHEQPWALDQTVAGRVDTVNGNVNLPLKLSKSEISSFEDVHLVACGTSYHAGLYAAKMFGSFADIRTSVEFASEYRFPPGTDPKRTLVILISQSGETADTLAAGHRAVQAGARTLAVTNTVMSSLTREVDDVVYIHAGPEIGVAATKTFAAQVATLALLAIRFGRVRRTLSEEVARKHLTDLSRVPEAIQYVLNEESAVREMAREYADEDGFFFIGRRYGLPVALEAALKLKEISYLHAEAFAAGELKHGPLALVTPHTPVIVLLTEGTDAERTASNVKEVQARGAPVIAIASELDIGPSDAAAKLGVPPVGVFEPLVANVYLQLFAYHVAVENGCPIDRPRNLAKSVTVE